MRNWLENLQKNIIRTFILWLSFCLMAAEYFDDPDTLIEDLGRKVNFI